MARSPLECVSRRNNKNFFDQSLDEIKLLKFLNLQVVRSASPACAHARAHAQTHVCLHWRACARTNAHACTRAHTHTRVRAHARTNTRARARAPRPAAAGSAWRPVWLPQDPVEHSHIIRLYDFFYFKANLTPPALWRPPPSHWLQPSLPRTRRAPARFRGPTPRAALQEHLFIVCELMHENL